MTASLQTVKGNDELSLERLGTLIETCTAPEGVELIFRTDDGIERRVSMDNSDSHDLAIVMSEWLESI